MKQIIIFLGVFVISSIGMADGGLGVTPASAHFSCGVEGVGPMVPTAGIDGAFFEGGEGGHSLRPPKDGGGHNGHGRSTLMSEGGGGGADGGHGRALSSGGGEGSHGLIEDGGGHASHGRSASISDGEGGVGNG